MVSNYLKVGCTNTGKVSVRHPEPSPTPLGAMWLFTPKEARDFARMLVEKAQQEIGRAHV